MPFCPYRGREVAPEHCSVEHIIPTSMGGSRALTITSETAANNILGSEVDARVAALYAGQRLEFDVRGHSRNPPSVRLDVVVEDLDDHPAVMRLTETGAELRLEPRVTFTEDSNGKVLSYSVEGEPNQAREIAANIRRNYERQGRTVDHTDLDERTVPSARIRGTVSLDALVPLRRFHAKVVLAVGHWLWGSDWSSGQRADALRRVLWDKSGRQVLDGLSDSVEPSTFHLNLQAFEHAIVVAPVGHRGDDTAIGFFPFGTAGRVTLTRRDPATLDGDGLMFVLVDVRARAVRVRSMAALLKEDGFARFRPRAVGTEVSGG